MVVRSYVRVFKLDRRIYSFGDWQLPLPNGIPLRGLTYFCGALLLSLLLWKFPPTGLVFGVFPWPVRHVILPLWIAAAGMTFSPDGRRADLFLVTWLCLTGRRVMAMLRERLAGRNKVSKLRVRHDASDTVLHRGGRIVGPARAVFRDPHVIEERWDGRYAEAGGTVPLVYDVAPGETLKVRP